MKVLQVSDFRIEGGAEKVFGETVRLVSTFAVVEEFVGSENWRLPDSPAEYVFSRKYYRTFLERLEEYRPDVIHLHNYYHLLSPSILAAIRTYRNRHGDRNVVKVVYTAHDYHLACPQSGYCYYVGEKLYRFTPGDSPWRMLQKCIDRRGRSYSFLRKFQWGYNYLLRKRHREIDAIIAPGEYMATVLRPRFDSKVSMVRHSFEIASGAGKVRSRKYTSLESIVQLVYLGRVDPEKGLKEFLSALAGWESRPFKLDVIGEGKSFQDCKNLASHLGMSNSVAFLGRIDYAEVTRTLPRYDAIVIPSLWCENAPLVVVEAALADLSLLLSGWGGLRELGDLVGDAWYFDVNNPDSIRKALDEYCLSLKSPRREKNSWKALENEFGSARYVSSLKQLYGAE